MKDLDNFLGTYLADQSIVAVEFTFAKYSLVAFNPSSYPYTHSLATSSAVALKGITPPVSGVSGITVNLKSIPL